MSYIKINENDKKIILDGADNITKTLYDTGDADAQPEDVAEGKVFYNSEGRQVGTKLLNNNE